MQIENEKAQKIKIVGIADIHRMTLWKYKFFSSNKRG